MTTSSLNPYPVPGRPPTNRVQAAALRHLERADDWRETARRHAGTPAAAAALALAWRHEDDAAALVGEHDA